MHWFFSLKFMQFEHDWQGTTSLGSLFRWTDYAYEYKSGVNESNV